MSDTTVRAADDRTDDKNLLLSLKSIRLPIDSLKRVVGKELERIKADLANGEDAEDLSERRDVYEEILASLSEAGSMLNDAAVSLSDYLES